MVFDVDGKVSAVVADQHIGRADTSACVGQTAAHDHRDTVVHRLDGAALVLCPVGGIVEHQQPWVTAVTRQQLIEYVCFEDAARVPQSQNLC
jgi:hypothetical protein